MHTIKEKVGNAAAAAKEHIDVMKARAEEMVRLFSLFYFCSGFVSFGYCVWD